jgi:hypothetical protein
VLHETFSGGAGENICADVDSPVLTIPMVDKAAAFTKHQFQHPHGMPVPPVNVRRRTRPKPNKEL